MEKEDDGARPQTRKTEWANFPLSPCELSTLDGMYYAIGNSPARNIFLNDMSSLLKNVGPMQVNSWRHHAFDPKFEDKLSQSTAAKRENLRVLCLACGDLRHVLCSLGDVSGVGNISLVINDYDTHVVARNILLLDMILDNTDTETIFAVWFSTGLYPKQRDELRKQLLHLIQRTTDGAANWSWQCYEPGLKDDLVLVWKKWLDLFPREHGTDEQYWNQTQKLRLSTFSHRFKKLSTTSFEKMGEGSDDETAYLEFVRKHRASRTLTKVEGFLSLDNKIIENWKEDIVQHLLTGVLQRQRSKFGRKPNYCVNPTLFRSQDKYDLHYGTDSFSAFPCFLPTKDHAAAEVCFDIFQKWIENVKSEQHRLTWLFSCLDCRTFCLNFDPKLCDWNDVSLTQPRDSFHPSKIQRGSIVTTYGLQSSPHYNDCLGVITTKRPREGRWGVKFLKHLNSESSENLPHTPVSVKEINLQQLDAQGKATNRDPWISNIFDVITTSNVADHIGLSTLLVMSRPLLVPGGILLTSTFLQLSRFKSTLEFAIADLLGTKPHLWSTLFGFRAIGFENDSVTTDICRLAHSDFTLNYGTGRSDSTVVWLATEQLPNLPLDSQGPIVKHLANLTRNPSERAATAFVESKVAAILSRTVPFLRDGSQVNVFWDKDRHRLKSWHILTLGRAYHEKG